MLGVILGLPGPAPAQLYSAPALSSGLNEGRVGSEIVELVRGELAFLPGLELYPLVHYIRIAIVAMVHGRSARRVLLINFPLLQQDDHDEQEHGPSANGRHRYGAPVKSLPTVPSYPVLLR